VEREGISKYERMGRGLADLTSTREVSWPPRAVTCAQGCFLTICKFNSSTKTQCLG
jgi:hypothetical protein